MKAVLLLILLALDSGWRRPVEVDLLKLLDLKKDVIAGEWAFEEGKLVTPGNWRNDRVQVPYEPPAEYDLTVVLRRKEETPQSESLNLGLPTAAGRTMVILDGWSDEEAAGIHLIDSKGANENETTTREKRLFADRETTVVCRVRKTGLAVLADGKSVFDWKGDLKRLTIPPTWATPNARALVLGCCDRFVISRLTLSPVSGPGKPTR